jgi:hypothetical protein
MDASEALRSATVDLPRREVEFSAADVFISMGSVCVAFHSLGYYELYLKRKE